MKLGFKKHISLPRSTLAKAYIPADKFSLVTLSNYALTRLQAAAEKDNVTAFGLPFSRSVFFTLEQRRR